MIRRWWGTALAITALSAGLVSTAAAEAFVAEDIRVEGLQRIDEGTVFSYLPIEPGDRIDDGEVAGAIRELYRSGFFRDIELIRDEDALVVRVQERPSIARLTFEGNEQIGTEKLRKALRSAGMSEGQIFDRAQLSQIERELRQQYYAQGKYDVSVESTVSPLERNRVAIRIDIEEGPAAEIREIHLTGNEAFSDDELLRNFELRAKRWWAPWSNRHRYARERLANDLESLRSHYLNRGYLNFSITSTQVSISPDRRDVHIAVNVAEGQQYKIGSLDVRGNLVVPPQELRKLIERELERGALYARNRVNAASAAIRSRLAEEGYAFSNVDVRRRVDEDEQVVDLTFSVDPGERVYVRRINITGNQRTQDEVIRRELRQLEGAPLSSEALEASQTRLNRLGFFSAVEIDTPRVPGERDRVDVDVKVQERMTGQLQAGIGYGDVQGFLVNFSVSQDNLLGTGDRLSMTVNNSSVSTVYNISYTDRYYTQVGVSRTLSAGYRDTSARRADLADYDLTAGHGSIEYSVPVTDVDRLAARLRFERLTIRERSGTPDWIAQYLDAQGGDRFAMIKPRLSWRQDTRDRGVFPTEGGTQRLSLEGTLPSDDLQFYKVSYENRRYWPLPWLGDRTTFSLEGRFAYGDAYGDSEVLPFFENYYAGGVRTVRGYRGNYLGPRPEGGDPIGGNVRVLTKAQVIFPPTEEAQSVRLAGFVDAGQVFNTRADAYQFDEELVPAGLDQVELSQLRAAAGMALIWRSPVGPLTFSLAEPLNETEADETETFQFSLGTQF